MKLLSIIIIRPIIKIFGNVTKLISYVFHALSPTKRFLIPSDVPPLIKFGSKRPIPRTVWQTNYTNKVTLPVFLNYLFNRLIAPNWGWKFLTTEERERFVVENFSAEIVDEFLMLQIGAAQADFWRLLVLYKYGGAYLDIDAHFVFPPDLVIEKNSQESFLKIKGGRFSNYFMACAPGNRYFSDLIIDVTKNIQNREYQSVYQITGPGVLNRSFENKSPANVFYKYICAQGSFTNEHFQYIDKPQGKWTKEQLKTEVLKPKSY